MEALTARQVAVLAFVRAHSKAHGYPPTRVEIAHHFKFKSANGAHEHLQALERKGYLILIAGTSRGIRFPTTAVAA